MTIDPRVFNKYNIIDTCAVWNVLSSSKLYIAAKNHGVRFFCTEYVKYECLDKPRSKDTDHDNELKFRLDNARKNSDFEIFKLTLTDLEDVALLQQRKRLGLGELSSIILAKKSKQAFLTDDQKARKMAATVAGDISIQTTPYLLSHLVFCNCLNDFDISDIIKQHNEVNGSIGRYFQAAYEEACRCKLLNQSRID
jgi:hypothetical protein